MWKFWSFFLALVAGVALLPAQPARAAGDARPTLVARVVVPASALAAPRLGARRVMRLTGVAEWSRGAQWLMVTGRARDDAGRAWVRVQLPIRPNGTAGWVPRRSLRLTGTRVRFEVHLGSRRLEIWRGSRRVASWPAGIGRPGTPTPVGRYAIQDAVVTANAWRGIYGDFTVALTAHSPTLRTFMGGQALIGDPRRRRRRRRAGRPPLQQRLRHPRRLRAGPRGPLRPARHPGDHRPLLIGSGVRSVS